MDEGRAMRLALEPAELALVVAILSAHVPGREVWAFGSRTTGRAKPFSDLDLALEGSELLPLAERAALAEGFEESDLPFRVDLVDLLTVEAGFGARIRREGVRLQATAGEVLLSA